jgi:hypothetical protein
LNSFGSGLGQVAGSCEHGDEPSVSIKCGEFLDQLSVLLAPQGLCSMELVKGQSSPRTSLKLEDYLFTAVQDSLLNIFVSNLQKLNQL